MTPRIFGIGTKTIVRDADLTKEADMRALFTFSALGAAALLGIAPLASAAPFTFQNGMPNPIGVGTYFGTQDDTLYPDNVPGDGTSNYNVGTLPSLITNGAMTDGTRARAIMKFDVASLAGQGTVQSATLKLTEYSSSSGTSFNFNIYRIADANAGWQQGSGYYLAGQTTGDVCWNYLDYDTVNWAGSAGLATPVTDYDATYVAQGTFVNSETEANPVLSIALPASLIQDWIDDPSHNAGFLIALDVNGNGTNTAQFASSDNTTTAWHPSLAVTMAVPEPATGAMLLIGAGLMALRRRR
jgi:hypothetical protein